MMLWLPAARLEVVHVTMAVPTLPGSGTALQPLIDVIPSVKLTLPLGLLPETVAVKVTASPTAAGLVELISDVVVGAVPVRVSKP